MDKVKKAVIPAAGLGTRFLPATKTIPKEMLPIVDTPIMFFIVEEAVKAGIEDIIIVAGRGKTEIEDFFDVSYELQDTLEKQGKSELLEKIIGLKDMANIISIRQKEALGLGHAVLSAAPIVGADPFAVLLGDEIMIDSPGESCVTAQLSKGFEDHQQSTVAVMPVPADQVHKYGIIGYSEKLGDYYRVNQVVEKPSQDKAPSQLALPGRYVFDAKIMKHLKDIGPGKNGEIQLTDGMMANAKSEGLLATEFKARRYDAGDKLGFLQANIEIALDKPELNEPFKKYLLALADKLR